MFPSFFDDALISSLRLYYIFRTFRDISVIITEKHLAGSSEQPRRYCSVRKEENLMHKKTGLILFFLFTAALLSGCTTHYTRSDIDRYVREMTGLRDFTVSDEYRTITGDDDYQDKLWTVTDDRTGMEFHVLDDYRWGMESLTNSLKTDYPDVVVDFIRNDLPATRFLNIQTDVENSMYSSQITGSFADISELQECYSELTALRGAFHALGYPNLSVHYRLCMEHPLRSNTGYELTDGDSFGRTDSPPDYQEMQNKYVLTVMDYRYDGTMDSLTRQQIEDALDSTSQQVGVFHEDSGTYEFYEDIIADQYYGVSFGSLYEILKREGFAPYGSPNHYTFTGLNDTVYEISYDFNDYVYMYNGTPEKKGYYYIRSGEVVPMDYYFYNHFTEEEILEMTGLQITDQSGKSM